MFWKDSFICMSQRMKTHETEKLSASFQKVDPAALHSLQTPCPSRGPHFCQGLTAAQGQRSDHVFGQKGSLNLNTDSELLSVLLFRELSEKSNTIILIFHIILNKIFKCTFLNKNTHLTSKLV